MGAMTDCELDERHYTFTNSDSNYQIPVTSCKLEDIGYVEVFEDETNQD